MAAKLDDGELCGQVEIWEILFSFVDSMALKCAVELGIADIIHSHGGQPVTLSQIASAISDSASPDIAYLARIMRSLVRIKIFTAYPTSSGDGDTHYGLTEKYKKWLLKDSEVSLAPMIIMQNHRLQMAPWHQFSRCVKEGGTAYSKAHGCEIWDLTSKNPELNSIFNDAMGCVAKVATDAFLSEYKDGFSIVGSLLDLGGGTGKVIAEIVKCHPHIKGINFDLPHVVATAPVFPGVTHVSGNMFEAIPNADAIFMKWVMHDWSDENCVKILKNCRKSIPEKTGKVIILDIVLNAEGDEPFDDIRVAFDLVMMAHCTGGKERTELEWKKLVKEGEFKSYKITKIPALFSIIEAFPSIPPP